MLTPRSLAKATVLRITAGSPAWKPQAMFALETKLSTSASMPIVYAPKLSPRSELRSTEYLPIYEHLFFICLLHGNGYHGRGAFARGNAGKLTVPFFYCFVAQYCIV